MTYLYCFVEELKGTDKGQKKLVTMEIKRLNSMVGVKRRKKVKNQDFLFHGKV